MLLMQSLSQRRAGKVVNSSIRYADVKAVKAPTMGSMPQWMQGTLKNPPISVESPSARDLGIEAGVYGALMVLSYVNGASTPSGSYTGADVPGLILATSFGASLYFMTRRSVRLGKEFSSSFALMALNQLIMLSGFSGSNHYSPFGYLCQLRHKKESPMIGS